MRRDGSLLKRSVTIAGHRTSVSLEPLFWSLLKAAATEDGRSLASILVAIDEARTTNLSSAIRVWLVERLLARGGGVPVGPDSRPDGTEPCPRNLA